MTRGIIGAAIEVHRHLGPGFTEDVYEEALSHEFGLRKISFERQKKVDVHYKGACVGEGRLDFLVDGRLVVELKAAKVVVPVEVSRVISYLKQTGRPLALLINFNVSVLRDGVRRVIRSTSIENFEPPID